MFAFASAVRGYRVYQDLWKPSIGEKFVAKREFNNPMDKHGSNLRAVWVRNDITSCFAKSFPLPHLLFPHLLNQTSFRPFSCIEHLLAKLNIL